MEELMEDFLKKSQYEKKVTGPELIEQKAFEMAALKVDKINGDLRTAFDIMRNALLAKIELLKDPKLAEGKEKVSLLDMNVTINQLY
mmetsp:Transcript_37083/g.35793  ORF Transcript_37083/g.35793 Transcript_37083/m.35793 type:complete len:87 (+) Transcript_37083:165-425(+)|eukprot:CAMPEP_0170555698 /NCGR_PEP_ID=MMETSP0211-20121228/13554_1 /TAXON_ID=311385 /ORGANISM="Pseudokeronopsis sp., Strain OXSARD2" /LENGTH=86 /DNA_ID=CAMNT_0010865669 /DNA_START=265 /DNA_END=525 /DNA_ORIENTATION=-